MQERYLLQDLPRYLGAWLALCVLRQGRGGGNSVH